MKLFASFSEAIREGAKLRPQSFGIHGRGDGKACAVYAGCLAAGLDYWTDAASDAFPYLLTESRCPACEYTAAFLFRNYSGVGLLVHLNDKHKWTRERIADWLETEEEKLGYITVIEAEETVPLLTLGVG